MVFNVKTIMDVLLYSKFSNASKKLLSQLQKTPVLLESISLVCIDNKKIRDKILNDEKIKVQGVPCFIRLNEETGNFDIFEGHNAFDFFTTMQNVIKEKEKEKENAMKENAMKEQLLLQQRMLQQQLDEKPKKKVEFVQESERQPKEFSRGQDFETLPKIGKLKTSMTFTPIEDLDLEIENESEKGINTFVHVDKNEHSDFSEREVSSKQAEQTLKVNAGGNLLAKAMKMQKERDTKA